MNGQDISSNNGAEALKQFHNAPRGPWEHVPEELWNDWRWQLRRRIRSADQLERLLPRLAPEEKQGLAIAGRKLAFAITPYFFNLIDPEDPNCPIRRQVIPRIEEARRAPEESFDPCGEEAYTPVPGIVHRYPDRALFLAADRCAAYCRYCTRSRLVSNASGCGFRPRYEEQIAYIARNRQIRDVLLSGGDPLLLSDERLDWVLSRLRAIPHVELLRIGTRIPIFLPQRITPELCAVLRRHHPLFVSIHSNHPRELTREARQALEKLADAGVCLGNQSVLLRGVNDDARVMKAHVQKLLICRVRPYYIYQCDLVTGSAHFRTSIDTGLEIIRAIQGHTTGYAVPHYVVDTPNGGKIPLHPQCVVRRKGGKTLLRNSEGKLIEYPKPSRAEPTGPLDPLRMAHTVS